MVTNMNRVHSTLDNPSSTIQIPFIPLSTTSSPQQPLSPFPYHNQSFSPIPSYPTYINPIQSSDLSPIESTQSPIDITKSTTPIQPEI